MNNRLYDAAQVRELDRIAIEDFSTPSYTLMCRAGKALADTVQLRWPASERILILCGAGNNGGDGYVLAGLLASSHIQLSVHSTVEPDKLRGDAKRAYQDYMATPGARVSVGEVAAPESFDLIVDAIFGSGLCRKVEGSLARLIQRLNAANKPILSVDVPSGLDASTGTVLGTSIRADVTMTFIGLKRGLLTNDGPDHTGQIFLDELGVSSRVFDRLPCSVYRTDSWEGLEDYMARKRNTHKGSYGRVAVVGGNHSMQGAAELCAVAALRSGAGLVRTGTRTGSGQCELLPDLIRNPLSDGTQCAILFKEADVLAVGPGLGQDSWAESLYRACLQFQGPCVYDADALNLLAENPIRLNKECVLTPHPAEAARLLACITPDVQKDRFTAVKALADKYNAVVVLKGCGTLISDGEQVWLSDKGNPGMSCAGMGDVLTGAIAGLLGQGLSPIQAAVYGVSWHARAGDSAYSDLGNSLLASDVLDRLARTRFMLDQAL